MIKIKTILVILVLNVGTSLLAQVSGGSFKIIKSNISSGGAESSNSSTGFVLKGTVGQSIAHNYSSGGTFKLTGGFWSSGAPAELIFKNSFETTN